MSKRLYHSLLGLLLLAGLAPASAQTGSGNTLSRPNVLFICIDDLNQSVGCYGDPHAITPNIDGLAKRGVLFRNHFVQVAVCNPSRTSMLLGMRPDQSKVFTLSCKFQDHVPWAVSIPQYFATQGYHSVGIGKIDHGTVPDPQNWSEPKLRSKGSREWSRQSIENLAEWKKKAREEGKDDNYINRRRANCIEMEDVPDNGRIDGANADVAVAKLTELKKLNQSGQPFFFAVGFIKPHMPFSAPRKYWDMHDPAKLPLSERTTPPKGAPRVASNLCYELRDYIDFVHAPHPHDGGLSDDEYRQLKHGYYACVSYMDAQIGRLLAALDEQGLSENTIIVLWSDHGWKLGDYRSIGKMTNYEIDTASPLLIVDPRNKQLAGTERVQLVESLDIFPTLCDLVGLPKPAQLDGASLLPLLDDPKQPSREAAYTQYLREQYRQTQTGGRILGGTMGHAVRTGAFRYVVWRDHLNGNLEAEELYDLGKDPLEMTNVVDLAQHAEALARLRLLEAEYWKRD